MINYVKRLLVTGICLLLLSVMFACENKHQERRDELIIGVSQDYRATDVYSHKGFNCLVFQTLVKMDGKGAIVPFLAEAWDISKDGMHYTFHLRNDVTFSDGTPLTAQQVKESMFYKKTKRRRRGPGRNSWGGTKRRSNNGRSWKGGAGDINPEYGTFDNQRYKLPNWYSFESIDVIDEHTLRFNLPRPYTLFLNELATTHMYPVLKEDNSEKVTGYIGTGPYMIHEHKRNQYMILVGNKHYWQGPVIVDRIRLRVIPDPETRAIALEAGEIDMTGYDHFDKIPNESVIRLKNLPFVTVKTIYKSNDPSVSYIAINYKKDIFKEPDTRRAIALAINRKEIEKVISETGRTIKGPLPQDRQPDSTEMEPIEFDPAKAKKLLTKAGWVDKNDDGILDKNGKDFIVTLNFNSFDPQYKDIAEIVQAHLKKIGITTKLEMLELGAHINVMRNAEYDLAIWPQMRYHMFYYTAHPSWLNVFNSPPLDDAFTRYLHIEGKEKNLQAFQETRRLIQESHVFPLYFERFDVVAWNNKRLKNFEPLPLGWDLSLGLWKAGLK